MRDFIRKGLSFGLTSGTITTLGLMAGLHSETGSKAIVIGGILTIAIADAFSDALGIHVSEESQHAHTRRQIWAATLATFAAKFLFALTFLIPLLVLPLSTAIAVSVGWGLLALALLSYLIARSRGERPWRAITEHLVIAIVVVTITHLLGDWLGRAIE